MLLIQNFSLFLAENDYSMAFYVSDAFYLVALLVSLTVKVNMGSENQNISKKQKKKENRKAIKQLFTPSAWIFFAMIFQGGLMWGIKDTYLFVYFQENLGASSQFIGLNNTVVSVAAGKHNCGILCSFQISSITV